MHCFIFPNRRYNGTRKKIQITHNPERVRAFLMPCGDPGSLCPADPPRGFLRLRQPHNAPQRARIPAGNALRITRALRARHKPRRAVFLFTLIRVPPVPQTAQIDRLTHHTASPGIYRARMSKNAPDLVLILGKYDIYLWKFLDISKISYFLATFLLFFYKSAVLSARNGQKSKVVKSKVATKKPHEKS